jgi:hypothetical protein
VFAVLQTRPAVLVVDDFYARPDAVRAFALRQPFAPQADHYKGLRTKGHRFAGLCERFGQLLGAPVSHWDTHLYNGSFQLHGPADRLVFHSDAQTMAGAVYLSPEAPVGSGTNFYRSKATGLRRAPTPVDAARAGRPARELERDTYVDKLLDPDAWELVDRVGAVYNRLVLWDAKLIHAAGGYFGDDADPTTKRLSQVFFFDL